MSPTACKRRLPQTRWWSARKPWNSLKRLFDTEPLGLRKIKGLAQAIPIHRLTRVRPGANRFGGRSRRGATRMIGRKRALDRMLRWWKKTGRQSQCTTVHLVGEAGVGKTVLWPSSVRKRNLRTPTYCSPTATNSTQAPRYIRSVVCYGDGLRLASRKAKPYEVQEYRRFWRNSG